MINQENNTNEMPHLNKEDKKNKDALMFNLAVMQAKQHQKGKELEETKMDIMLRQIQLEKQQREAAQMLELLGKSAQMMDQGMQAQQSMQPPMGGGGMQAPQGGEMPPREQMGSAPMQGMPQEMGYGNEEQGMME
jgi:hypothetical protein